MKAKISFLSNGLLIVILAACSPTQTVTNSDNALHDGSTTELAILVNSIDAEYEWIRNNYPGSKVISQALLEDKKKHYDLLTFMIPSGETKKTYFDISRFYGKY